jgi:hypothetical protein
MFSNKFNPDVLNTFNENLNTRNNNKYELKNVPYKLIINDNSKKVKTSEDLVIVTNNENKNIEADYKSLLNERNIKIKDKVNKSKIKDQFELKNINMNEDVYVEDFKDIKDSFESEFKITEKELQKDRDKFNSILDSLLSDGLLD